MKNTRRKFVQLIAGTFVSEEEEEFVFSSLKNTRRKFVQLIAGTFVSKEKKKFVSSSLKNTRRKKISERGLPMKNFFLLLLL